jgi:hypothetical protein
MKKILICVAALVAIAAAAVVFAWWRNPRIGHVKDEAMLAGLQADDFHAADEDFFRNMDNGVNLEPDEIKGRNTWIVWTAGNDRLWDKMAYASVGALDFLKTLSSHPGLPASRDNRWDYLGRVRAGPVRKRAEVSRRQIRRTGQKHSGGLLLWLRYRHRRSAAFPEPGL